MDAVGAYLDAFAAGRTGACAVQPVLADGIFEPGRGL